MNPTALKVSVSIIAYNNEPYIAQAIESALSQQTDYPFEILIGEDQSADRTREIVEAYARRYPDKIRLFLHDYEPGFVHRGGGWNFLHNLRNARGEYIAWLDGDDYWNDLRKLQKQVDFLESNPSFSMCFHNVLLKDEVNEGKDQLAHQFDSRRVFTLEDIIKGNFIYTCSVMFRRSEKNFIPNWYIKCPIGDWPFHVLNARKGDIGYLPDVMGVYRIHNKNFWSSKSVTDRRLICYEMIDTLDRFLKYEYHEVIEKRKIEILLSILSNAIEIGNESLIDDLIESLQKNRYLQNDDLWKIENLIGRDALFQGTEVKKSIAKKIFAFVLKNVKIDELNKEEGERYFFLLSLLLSSNDQALSETGFAGKAVYLSNQYGYSSIIKLVWDFLGNGQYERAIRTIGCLQIEKMNRDDGESYFLLLTRMFLETAAWSSERKIEGYLERFAAKFGNSYKLKLAWDFIGKNQYERALKTIGCLQIEKMNRDDRESYFLLLTRMLLENAGRSSERKIEGYLEQFVAEFGNSYKFKLARSCFEKKLYQKCIEYLGELRADEIVPAERADYYLILYYSNKNKLVEPSHLTGYATQAIRSIIKKSNISNLDAYRVASLYSDLKEYKKAIKWFNVVIRYNEDKRLLPGCNFHLGVIFNEIGDSEKSIRSLRACLKYDPEFGAAELLLKRIDRRSEGKNNA